MNKKTIVGIITVIAVIGVAIGLGVYFTSDAYKHPDCVLFKLEGKEQLGNGVCDYAANSNPMRDYNPNLAACEWDMGEYIICLCSVCKYVGLFIFLYFLTFLKKSVYTTTNNRRLSRVE